MNAELFAIFFNPRTYKGVRGGRGGGGVDAIPSVRFFVKLSVAVHLF